MPQQTGPGRGGGTYTAQPVPQENMGDILTSFGQGALEGPSKAIGSIPSGVAGVWHLIKALPDPKARKQMSDAWTAMSPQDKQHVLDGVGEAMGAGIGGAAGGASGAAGGAFAFGLGAIPGAAAGAMAGAAGGGVAGHFVSRLVGRYTNPGGSDGYTASQNARDVGNALTGSAALEGVARVPGMFANAVRASVAPTADAARVAKIATAEGIPQSLGVATGNPMAQKIEAALSRHPFSSGTMLAAKQKAQAAFEQSINNFMEKYHAGEVGPEAFHDAVGQAMTDARSTLQGNVDASVAGAQKQFGPMRTPMQAGQDLQKGLADNSAMLKTWADKQYPALFDQANRAGVSINPQAMSDAAGSMIDRIAPETRWAFPQKAMSNLKNASDMREPISIDTADGIVPGRADAMPLTMEEAVKLRSQLLDAQRRLPHTASALDRESLGTLTNTLDQSIDSSMKDSGDTDLLAKWRMMSQQYKQGAEATRPPAAPGKAGNPMTRSLRNQKEPEKLVSEVSDNPSSVAQANLATDPDTITRITDPTMNTVPPRPPMDSVRGSVLGGIIDKSKFANDGRISPNDVANSFSNPNNSDRLNALFGGRTDELTDAMSAAAPTEDALYNSKLGKTLDGVNGDSSAAVRNAAFPRRDAPAARSTLDLFPIGPSQPGNVFGRGAGARGYVEGLATDSTRPGGPVARSTGQTRPVLDPNVMTKKVADAGETVPAVLGDDGAGQLGDILEAGRSTFSPDMLYGNSSGTAHMREMFNTAGRVGKAVVQLPTHPIKSLTTLGQTGAGILGAQGAARLVNSPSVVRWATGTPEAVAVSTAANAARALEAAGTDIKKPKPLASDDDIPELNDDDIPDLAVPAGKKR